MKKAFTLLEIIFVIVLIGILAGVAVFYFRANDSELVQAKNQLINHIRYTQHLALMDDKFSPSDRDWYKGRWRISFSGSSDYPQTSNYVYYNIYSDSPDYRGGIDKENEVAIDPYKGARLGVETDGDKSRLITNLVQQYNVEIVSVCDSDGKDIVFDVIGRPYKFNSSTDLGTDSLPNSRAYQNLLTSSCEIKLRHLETGEPATITIHPETGLVE
jgi:prepilin-type N-terminal cleavage/methylation domain-containing protein